VRNYEDMTEPELADLMRGFARAVTVVATSLDLERPVFVLLVFNDPAAAQYISNGERADVVRALRTAAARLESRDVIPRVDFPEG
jgi:hypothetical protein